MRGSLRSGARRLGRFVRLPAAERWLLITATLLLGATRAGLWLLPFGTVRRVLAEAAEAPVGFRGVERSSVGEVVWAVGVAGRILPWASTCLTEALAAQVLLARRGYPATLRIGMVRGQGDRLEAHAWVESGGRAVIGAYELERYAPLVDPRTQKKP
jgi:hypothetical protein